MQQSQISLQLLKMHKSESATMVTMLKKQQSHIQQQLKIAIGVWNLQGLIPPKNSIKILMQQLSKQENETTPDLICVSTQECQRSITMSLFCQNKQQWENALKESCGPGYKLVESQTMRALHMAIFVKTDIANCFTTQTRKVMKAGTCNVFGNKGAISLVVNLLGQNFQFINCHLEAHQDQCPRRNQVLLRIINQIAEKDYRNEVFICGDLNYRIDMTHQEYDKLVKTKKSNTNAQFNYHKMIDQDQLKKQEQLKNAFFPFYKEQPITFPPTYKIGGYTQEYDKKRIPGWTDRIFHRKGRAKQLSYRCLYQLFGTDHRPIIGTFKVQTEETLSIFPQNMVAVKTRDNCALI